jgi:quercetin dioxygenase-like cupin family protein
MTLRELKEGTEEAPVSQLAEVIKKAHRLDRYAYNNQVYADMLTRERHFSAVELVLESGGKTRVEEDPLEIGKFEKWVYCLTGSFTCVIGQEVHTLQKGDCLSFQSNIPHSFQNDSSRQTRAIVIQSPKYI